MNKLLLLLFFALSLGNAKATERIDMTINSGWYFHKGDITTGDNNFDTGQWENINLPHTWNQYDAFDQVPGYWRGTCWYAYPLRFPDDWKGKNIIIHFEGANQVAEVFVNDEFVGKHVGGYTAFNFDITDYLNVGKKNIIKVKLDNSHNKDIPPLSADFTFYGGIYRNVRLKVIDPVHFNLTNHASDGVFVSTPEVNENNATLKIDGSIVNNTGREKKVLVENTLFDKNRKKVLCKKINLMLKPNTTTPFTIEGMNVSLPELWTPQSPVLYKNTVRIVEQGKDTPLDAADVAVGFRWFSFNGEGFFLNGRKYNLKGVNRHQDFSGKGNALTDDYHINDYTHIKSLGFNFVRLAHYPQAPEVYRLCDELGLLVWSEIPVVNDVTPTQEFTDNSLNMMREQIRQTKNHPSVILYGYMNEILIRMLSDRNMSEQRREQIAEDTRNLAHKLEKLVKEEAPDRNTVMAVHYHQGYNKYEVSTISDVLGYNLYFGWYYEELSDLTRFLNSEHEKFPNRPIIVSECGADGDIRNHSLNPRPWDFSEEYEVALHSSYIRQMAALPYIAGYALWNFADFGAENRADAVPFINQKGLVNYDRSEKDVASLYRAAQSLEPILYIASRNYTLRKGVETAAGSGICTYPVKVFSNGKYVDLYHNNKLLGRKQVEEYITEFEIPFTDGENILEAGDDSGSRDRLSIDFSIIAQDISRWNGNPDIAVNVGSDQYYVDINAKTVWLPDQIYKPRAFGRIGGTVFEKKDRQRKIGIANNILGTDNNPIFQTFVEGLESFRFDVPDGTYCVTLCFVENNPKSPTKEIIYNLSSSDSITIPSGVREFSVWINNMSVLNNLNLARDYGNLRAVQFDIVVKAIDSKGIWVDFKSLIGKTTLSGIRVRKM